MAEPYLRLDKEGDRYLSIECDECEVFEYGILTDKVGPFLPGEQMQWNFPECDVFVFERGLLKKSLEYHKRFHHSDLNLKRTPQPQKKTLWQRVKEYYGSD